jgi:DnaK suppressor protein
MAGFVTILTNHCEGYEMNEEKLGYFRKVLNQRLKALLEEAGKAMDDLNEAKVRFPDPTDGASAEFERDFLLKIKGRERKLINKVQEALARIEDGTYGICEACGARISEKRLKARPVTTLCIKCKTKQEEEEKRLGE